MAKAGRPKKPRGTTKEEYLELRLAAAERQAFWDTANLAGTALSVWVRERLRKAARKELDDTDEPAAFVANQR